MNKHVERSRGTGSFTRGIHPPGRKALAAEAAIEVLPTPRQVAIPLLQHAGAPCTPTVKPKQDVALGDAVGSCDAFIAAPVHASLSGTVQRLSAATLPNGRRVKTVPIIASADPAPTEETLYEDHFGGDWMLDEPSSYDPGALARTAREAGLVGMGGAAFPTHVKLTRNADKPVGTLLLNGCECEPYLTADYRLMIEAPAPILAGARLAARACGAADVILAVEDNKPEALAALRGAAEGTGIEVKAVRTRYPMGGERQLVVAVLGKEVPTGGLPLDIGVVVLNVGTAAALARAVLRGKPLTHRVVSVTGEGLRHPRNLLTPVGTAIGTVLDYCGGLTENAARVVAGGPMMGFTVGDLNTPVTKGTSGLVVLTAEQVARGEETACLRCGRCVEACPLGLAPARLALAARTRDWDMARRYHLSACCECGCCAYVCPAAIPLVQWMRMGKALMPRS